MGISLFAVTAMSLSSSMIQPLRGCPDLTPSTTTTPTPSPSSCTTKWITPSPIINSTFGETLFYSHVRPPPVPADTRLARNRSGCSGNCFFKIQNISIHPRGGVGLPRAARRRPVDAAHGRARPGRDTGALGNRHRRGDEIHRFLGTDERRSGMGAFRARRSAGPGARALVLVPLHRGRCAKPGGAHAHRAGRRHAGAAAAVRVRLLPAVRARLVRRVPAHRGRRPRPDSVPGRLYLRRKL